MIVQEADGVTYAATQIATLANKRARMGDWTGAEHMLLCGLFGFGAQQVDATARERFIEALINLLDAGLRSVLLREVNHAADRLN